MQRNLNVIVTILLTILTSACQPTMVKTVSPEVITHTPLQVAITATFIPSGTPTATHYPKGTTTRTPAPSLTPKPTKAPTTTPTPFVSLDLPVWAAISNIPILLAAHGNYDRGFRTLALWNGQTGERFDLITPKIDGYFWLPDGSQLGLLRAETNDLWLVNLIDGQVTTYTLSESQLKDVSRSEWPIPLQAFNIPASENFRLLNNWKQVSSDGKYMVDLILTDDGYNTGVKDLMLGESFPLTDPEDKWSNIEQDWVPTKPYLAILQSDVELGPYYSSETPATFRIVVYDVPARRPINIYYDMVFVKWSWDGIKLLYQSPDDLWYGQPCVFNTLSGEHHCFSGPQTRHRYAANGTVGFFNIMWLTDNLNFAYLYYSDPGRDQLPRSGICILALDDSNEKCLLESLENPPDYTGGYPYPDLVKRFWPAPNWEVLLYEMDSTCPLCDEAIDPKNGFVNVNTGESFLLDEYFEGDKAIWRP